MPILGDDWPCSDGGDILFLMLYPDDARKRQCAQVNAQMRARLDSIGQSRTVTISLDDARALVDAADPETLRQEQAERARAGIVAGMILLAMYVMHRFALPASMNKAIWAFQAYSKEATYGDGSKLPISDSKIREHWRLFAPVAHFWAATRINREYPFAPDRLIFKPEHLPVFFEVAAGIHRFSTTFIPKRARPPVPIVDPESAWALPSIVRPRELKSERIPERLVELLRGYKAPQALAP